MFSSILEKLGYDLGRKTMSFTEVEGYETRNGESIEIVRVDKDG